MTAPLTTDKPETPQPGSIAQRFSLLLDKADDAEIDRSLRAGVELSGATPWILMFAIVIASVGLNTNSTAVIIGAMLVSPLMGPIVGIGYGIGIFDFALIRRSLANIGIAAGISLITSTLYFSLTPISEAQSELLARTTPSLWDVLIALAGGLAGIIGLTRREKSNVIPGVAIATALMPPLCTAGYGLANANWSVFLGAFYLFSINCVFIAFAAVIVIDILRLPHRKFVDKRVERRVKRALLVIVLLTGLPSIYLAIGLVNNEVFRNRARQFVHREFQGQPTHVVETRVDPGKHEIELTLIGPRLPQDGIRALEKRLPQAGLGGAHLVVHQAEDAPRVDVTSLKADLLAEILRDSQQTLHDRDATIEQLRKQIAAQAQWLADAGDLTREFAAQYPSCADIAVGEIAGTDPKGPQRVPLLSARCTSTLDADALKRAEDWFKVRTKSEAVKLLVQSPPASARKRRRR